MGDRRRRIGGVLAIMLAAAASAATSYAPPPAVLTETTGEFRLTADAPAASVEITVVANAALRSVPGRTTVSLSNDPSRLLPGPQPPVVAWLVDLGPDARFAPLRPSTDALRGFFELDCPVAGDCERRYRITAALVDPSVEEARFAWRAVAETRFTSGASGATEPPAPAGSSLEVQAGPVERVDPTTVAGAATPVERVELGPTAPVAVRDLLVTLPGGRPSADFAGGVLLSAVTEGGSNAYREPILARLLDPRRPFGAGDDGITSIDQLFADCRLGEPCERAVRVELTWEGGRADERASVSWSAVAWTATEDEAAPAVALERTRTVAIEAQTPRLTASETGRLGIADRSPVVGRVRAILDHRAVDQRREPLRAWAVFRLRVASHPRSSDPIDVFFRSTSSRGEVAPGESLELVSPPVAVTCAGGSTCPATIDFEMTTQSGHGRIVWQVDAEVFYTEPIEPPPGATVTIEVTAPQ